MENVLVKFLLDNYPGLTLLVIGFIIVCLIIKYHPTIRDIGKKVSGLQCKEHSQKINTLDRDFMYVKGRFDTIIDTLNILVDKKDMKLKRKSPKTLTDFGNKIVRDYKLQTMVDDNWEKITSYLKGLKSQNPYDLEQACFEIAFVDTVPNRDKEFFTDNDIDKLKIIAFKAGENIVSYTEIIGVLIRDKYFKEIGIDVEEIDDLAPAFKLGFDDVET